MIRIDMEKPVSCKECPMRYETDEKNYCLPRLCKPLDNDIETRADFCPIMEDLNDN